MTQARSIAASPRSGRCRAATPRRVACRPRVSVPPRHIYWVRATNVGQVSNLPIGGGNITVLVDGPSGTNSLVVDSSNVYFTTSGAGLSAGTVNKVGLGGGATTQYASAQDAPMAIAVDTTSVYWTNDPTGTNTGSIMKVPLGGGATTMLATADSPADVAVNASCAYWVTHNGLVTRGRKN